MEIRTVHTHTQAHTTAFPLLPTVIQEGSYSIDPGITCAQEDRKKEGTAMGIVDSIAYAALRVSVSPQGRFLLNDKKKKLSVMAYSSSCHEMAPEGVFRVHLRNQQEKGSRRSRRSAQSKAGPQRGIPSGKIQVHAANLSPIRKIPTNNR